MMGSKQRAFAPLCNRSVEDLVPADHFYRHLDAKLDRSFVRELSILVRKLLRRGSFPSVDDLRTKVLAFIAYYNRTMAKPFRWTYQRKPLLD